MPCIDGGEQMNVLELFAGSRSIGKAADELQLECFSSDIESFEGIDYQIDIRKFDYSKLPFKPDIIWASPPCTGFTVAAIGRNWHKVGNIYTPKSDTARLGLELLQKAISIIQDLQPSYWFIENPRGMMRKMPEVASFKRHTVTYCQYGENRMKPTDIWTNSENWMPKPPCKNGDTCHVAAPRGSQTGTQGMSSAYEKSKIPHDLCLEVLRSCICPTMQNGNGLWNQIRMLF